MKTLIGLNTLFISLFMLITLFLYSQAGQAQTSGSPEREGRKGPEHLVELLKLSEDQSVSFLSVMERQHEKRMDVRKQNQSSREQEKNMMDALHEETIQLLVPILTAEQLTQFEEITKNQRPPHPEKETRNLK